MILYKTGDRVEVLKGSRWEPAIFQSYKACNMGFLYNAMLVTGKGLPYLMAVNIPEDKIRRVVRRTWNQETNPKNYSVNSENIKALRNNRNPEKRYENKLICQESRYRFLISYDIRPRWIHT